MNDQTNSTDANAVGQPPAGDRPATPEPMAPTAGSPLPWPQMKLRPFMEDRIDHEWHVAINKHTTALREADPQSEWPRWMYEAKDAALEVPRLALLFKNEREGKLDKTFRRCSCCPDEKHVVDNHLTCCLGVECRKCPHLMGMEKAALTPEQIDWVKSWTCVGHILANGGDVANTGFIITEDDKMYWDSVHNSLAMAYSGEGDESETENTEAE